MAFEIKVETSEDRRKGTTLIQKGVFGTKSNNETKKDSDRSLAGDVAKYLMDKGSK